MAKKLSKRAKKQIINITVLVTLIAITLVVVFVSQDFNLHDIGDFLSRCNPWYIVAAFGGMLGYVVFEAISLHIIARKLGHKSKFVSSMAYSTSDLYYSAITPSASGGQPASAFYMVRDGMSGGTAGFTVLFNIISYTVATILVGLFAVVARPAMFPQIGHWFAKTLIILGFVIQLLLLALLLLCLFRSRVILKIGNWGITLLTKMHIVKKPDKWRAKLDNVVVKYKACRGMLKQHPMLFVTALLLNTAQRVSQTLIPCFVCFAVDPSLDFMDMFCMQAYVLIGYNSIPLPGGTGAYEYLYPNVFGVAGINMTFILSAMMVSRAISYYACMIVCGLYTLIYHAVGLKNIKADETVPADALRDGEFDITSAIKQSLIRDGAADKEIDMQSPEPVSADTEQGIDATADDAHNADGDIAPEQPQNELSENSDNNVKPEEENGSRKD